MEFCPETGHLLRRFKAFCAEQHGSCKGAMEAIKDGHGLVQKPEFFAFVLSTNSFEQDDAKMLFKAFRAPPDAPGSLTLRKSFRPQDVSFIDRWDEHARQCQEEFWQSLSASIASAAPKDSDKVIKYHDPSKERPPSAGPQSLSETSVGG